MKRAPRLLIIEPRRLGDAILTLPIVRSAMEKYQVYICCPVENGPIYSTLLSEDRLITIEIPWNVRRGFGWFSQSFREARTRLARLNFDCVVSVWPDPRVHLLMNLIPARNRIGFLMNKRNYYAWDVPWRTRQLRIGQLFQMVFPLIFLRPILTYKLERDSLYQPHLENWHQIAETLELKWNTALPWFNPPEVSIEHPLHGFVVQAKADGRIIWLIHTGASAMVKRWESRRFKQLLTRLSGRSDIAVIVVCGPGETTLESADLWHRSHASLTLEDLFSLTAKIDKVLCNDSMMAHLAAALGKEVHTLSGPANPNWFAPFGNRNRVIEHDVCPHRPCFDRCVMPSPTCMESISVDEVFRKVFESEGPV